MHAHRNTLYRTRIVCLHGALRLGLLVGVLALAVAIPSAALAADEPDVVAESAIVVDASTGEVLLDRKASEPRAMASLSKLFTALVALELMPLDAEMVVEPADLVGEASMGLEAGDTLRFETLLHGLMLPSGNDAASTVARVAGGGSEEAFIERANGRVAELGLQQTHLVNPHGLDADGHYSSARDVAAVAMYALKNEPTIASAIHTPSYAGDGYTLYNTNRLLNTYPGLIGGKTGVTDAAGYCLMQVAEIDGRTVLVVLMGSTWESWYTDAERLLDYGFEALAIPGRVMGTDTITFPQPAAHVAMAAVPSSANGISVAQVSADTRVVSVPQIAASGGWSPWFWIGAVAVLVPSMTFIALQVQKLLALMAYGPPRRATSPVRAAGAPVATRNVNLETQPFPLVMAANAHSPSTIERWPHRIDAPARRAGVEGARDVVPAFSGD